MFDLYGPQLPPLDFKGVKFSVLSVHFLARTMLWLVELAAHPAEAVLQINVSFVDAGIQRLRSQTVSRREQPGNAA